jgi:hypothetical protein
MGLSMCGWCATNHHDNCKVSIKHYDVTWYCKCEQCFVEEKEVEDEASL